MDVGRRQHMADRVVQSAADLCGQIFLSAAIAAQAQQRLFEEVCRDD
jgi:hypothetical protein